MIRTPSDNLTSVFLGRRLAAGDGRRVAVIAGERQWTYAEVAALVDRTARAMLGCGVKRGERVVIVLPDSVQFVAGFLGAIKIGAVAVPCNTFLGPNEYRYFLQESEARVAIVADELSAQIDAALAHLPDVRLLRIDIDHHSGLNDSLEVEAAAGDDPAFWLWTSGTTGRPKAAVHRHQDPVWCCRAVAEDVLQMTAADRVFSAAKLFHAYGLGNGLFFPFWAGAVAVLFRERARPEAVFDVLHRTRSTIFFGVPTLFAAMLNIERPERFDLSSLRCCLSAAEPLPAELFERWKARFRSEILDGIGSTEMLHTYLTARCGRVKPGSVGTPLPGYEIKTIDETGEPVRPYQIGDLLVKGPSRAAMYWRRPADTAQRMLADGWFVSGDKFFVDEDGYYWYAGRSDDMFKVSGEWISPSEVEAVLIRHREVLECAVVPWSESSGVLKLKAYVVLKHSAAAGDALASELQQHVRDLTAHYKCPRTVEFVTDLPRTATGKIQRYKLRQYQPAMDHEAQ